MKAIKSWMFGPGWWTNAIFGLVLGITSQVLHLSTTAFMAAVVSWVLGRLVEEEITERRVRAEMIAKLQAGLKASEAAQAHLQEMVERRERLISDLEVLKAKMNR